MIGFAIDMDGTVYHGERPISGAKEFIDLLHRKGIPFRFITNNSSHSHLFYADRLKRMGFNIQDDDVLTSTLATIRFIKQYRPGKTVCPVAGTDVLQEIQHSGIPLVSWEEDPDIVMLTYDLTLDYSKINSIYHAMLNGSELIVTHPDDVCPSETGYDVDIGPFIALFENMTGKKATVVGKPNRLMLDMAALEMDVPADKIIMIGDRLTTDIKMAMDANVISVLVLSGETDHELLKNSQSNPTHVVSSISEIDVDAIIQYMQ